jgi:acetyl-CoA synthetase
MTDLIDRSSPAFDAAPTMADDPAFLIYTSGTTGPPKGALHAHRSLIGHLPGFELYYEFFPQTGDVIWTPADWAWIGALMDVVVPAWCFGMTVLTDRADFDPHHAVELMADHGVSLAFLPPTALKMMRAASVDGSALQLRAIFTGGEPLGEEMLAWASDTLGCAINEGYGQTEANIVAGNSSRVWPVRPGSMGKAIPGHDVQVQDDDGARLIGETDGYLWFESRKDDVILSMGYRIGPGEIEESLMAHPSVAMCAVVGVPDELRGEVPAAFVVLRDSWVATDELAVELQQHVRTKLAAHEVPRRVTFVADLPRTTTGKIMRRALRDG